MTDAADTGARRGRRAGHPDTRGTILAAAHQLFTSRGFEDTSIRAVARAAGVDPALVHHYYTDKVGLLLATAEITLDPRHLINRVTAGAPHTVGRRLIATVLTVWESPLGSTLVLVVRDQPALLHGFTSVISTNIAEALTGPLGFTRDQSKARLAMIETILGGIFMTRYIARMEPMASLPPKQVVNLLGPLIQQIIERRPAD